MGSSRPQEPGTLRFERFWLSVASIIQSLTLLSLSFTRQGYLLLFLSMSIILLSHETLMFMFKNSLTYLQLVSRLKSWVN